MAAVVRSDVFMDLTLGQSDLCEMTFKPLVSLPARWLPSRSTEGPLILSPPKRGLCLFLRFIDWAKDDSRVCGYSHESERRLTFL